jgi:hypothetical protein
MRLPYSFFALALQQVNFAVLPAELFHLLDSGMRLQLSFRALFQFAIDSLVVGIPICQQSLSQGWSGQALRDDKGIVTKCFKKFAQHLGLPGALCHAVHFGL